MRNCTASLLIVSLFAFGCTTGSGGPAQVNLQPLPADEVNYGHNYGEWGAEWWKWVFSLPVTGHPLFEGTGEDAATGQSGQVWFLGGSFTSETGVVERTVTIPANTALFFPLVNFEEDSAFRPDLDEAAMAAELNGFVGEIEELHLTVDGEAALDPFALRGTSPGAFAVELPATDDVHAAFGVVNAPRTIETVVSDGYWALIEPLPAGEHTISFGGTQGTGEDAFTQNTTYHITVEN